MEELIVIAHGGVDNFICGGEAGEDFADSVFAEGSHTEFASASSELAGGEFAVDHGADFVVDVEEFENSHTTAEAVAATFWASDGGEDGGIDGSGWVDAEGAQDFF